MRHASNVKGTIIPKTSSSFWSDSILKVKQSEIKGLQRKGKMWVLSVWICLSKGRAGRPPIKNLPCSFCSSHPNVDVWNGLWENSASTLWPLSCLKSLTKGCFYDVYCSPARGNNQNIWTLLLGSSSVGHSNKHLEITRALWDKYTHHQRKTLLQDGINRRNLQMTAIFKWTFEDKIFYRLSFEYKNDPWLLMSLSFKRFNRKKTFLAWHVISETKVCRDG